ncbi:MAG: hypothetical protein ACJAQT_000399 [Akkermansiaceae bacterium]|jgi:hypothetical protein
MNNRSWAATHGERSPVPECQRKNMMPILTLILTVLVSSIHANESVEPNLNYILKIGDRSYAVVEGEMFKVDPNSDKLEARLVADVHRIFTHQNLRFKYPREFSFEGS